MINLDETRKRVKKSLTDQGMQVSHSCVMSDSKASKYSLSFVLDRKGIFLEIMLEGSLEDPVWDMYARADKSLKHTFVSKMNVLD